MANLTIYTDIDCNIYIDTEFYGIAKANDNFSIKLNVGIYWIECRCIANDIITYDFDCKISNDSDNIREDVTLLNDYRLNELKLRYDYIGEFKHDFAEVRHNNTLVGYIDTSYQFKYDDINVLCDDILCVKKDGYYGVLNKGLVIIPIKYNSISLLGNNRLKLGLNDRFCIASLEGTKLTPLKYRAIEYAMDDTYALFFNEWQFVDYDINEIDIPNNVILYTTNDNKLMMRGGIFGTTYECAFCQEPQKHIVCNNMCLLVFGKAVTTIGKRAFAGCSNITNISIPNSVDTIGNMAFFNCHNLTEISIPYNTTKIDNNAFFLCKNLKTFKGAHSSSDGCCLIIDDTLIAFARGCNISNYTIPSNVKIIGDGAFAHCHNLTEVSIPNSVTTIMAGAFSCRQLKGFKGRFASADGCCLIVNGVLNTFAKGCDITSYTIPSNVTTIGDGAFAHCHNLTEVSIPDSVTAIGLRAFTGCEQLKGFKGRFASADGCCLIVNGVLNAFAKGCDITNYTIPSNVTAIGESTFRSCTSLTNVTIPDSVTVIGLRAFTGCEQLKGFKGRFASADGCCLIVNGVLKAFAQDCDISKYTIPNNVNMIGDYAFYGCKNLTEINILDSITTICDYAFSRCEKLIYATLGNVTSIGAYAFAYCGNITKIDIPDSVTTIDNRAFSGCHRLNKITIPESIIELNQYAFENCDNIHELVIPANIKKIRLCSLNNIKTIYCKAAIPPTAIERCFNCTSIVANEGVIYVPHRSYKQYTEAPLWRQVRDRIHPYDFENNTPKQMDISTR